MKNYLFLLLALLFCEQLFGQAKVRKLPNNINLPSINTFAPFVSLEGNTLVFTSDNAEDRAISMYYSIKVDAVNWKEPVMMPKNVNNRLNFMKGYAVSADGKTLFITTVKDGGWGGYDIFSCDQKGSGWAEPVNIGTSINTNQHEGCPSLSADGNTLYFMRCAKMMASKAEGCKLMVVKKKANGQWDTAVELPASINSGNSQSPRIMGDGEMLIFSSDKLSPNKGGMDLYMSRLAGETWSTPVPLDFANTPADDQYASATSLGRYLMKDQVTGSKSELVELLFPADLKPKALTKVDGKITGPANLASPYVTVYNLKDQSKVFTARPGKDGVFVIFLKEGNPYELSIEPEQDNYTFYVKTFDLTGDKISISEKVDAVIKPVSPGTEIELPGITFKAHGTELMPSSNQELRRLMRLMKGNASLKFNVDVTLTGFLKDSVKSNPDLTEIIHDSLHVPVSYEVIDTVEIIGTDSLATKRDSLITRTETRDSLVIKTTYHNDRTDQQGMAMVYYLVSQGIAADRLTHSHRANEEATLENRRTRVRVTARP